MNRILLYKKEQELINEVIDISNPYFTSGVEDWFTSTRTKFFWDSVNFRMNFNAGPRPASIYTLFNTSPKPLTYYNVSFDICVTGYCECYIGGDLIFSGLNVCGSQQVLYETPNFNSIFSLVPNDFRLFLQSGTTGWFTNLQIIRNNDLSPLYSEISYSPYGYLDLYETINVALNFNREDLNQFNQKQISTTKEFIIPATDNNNRLLSSIYDYNSEIFEFNPKLKTKAQIIEEDGSVIFDGWFILTDTKRERDLVNYQCQLLDRNFGVLDTLKNKKLQDLDFTDFKHKLNFNDISATWVTGRTWEDCYFYPLYYKQDSTLSYVINDDFYPVVYDRMIFDKIHKTNNIKYNLSPLVEEWMNNLTTTPSGGKKPNINQNQIDDLRIYLDNLDLFQGLLFNERLSQDIPLSPNSYFYNITANTSNIIIDNFNQFYETPLNYLIPETSGKYLVTVNLDSISLEMLTAYPDTINNGTPVESFNSGLSFLFNIKDLDSNEIISSSKIYSFTSFTSSTTVIDLPEIIIECDLTLGKKYSFQIEVVNDLIFKTQITITQGVLVFDVTIYYSPLIINNNIQNISINVELDTKNEVREGSLVYLNQWLPIASQYDFINDKIKQFNLLIIPQDNGEFLYISENEFYDETKQIIDLTGRIDTDSEIQTTYLSQITSSGVEFLYQDSDDFHNDQYKKSTKNIPYHYKLFEYDTDLFDKLDSVELRLYEPSLIVANDSGDIFPSIYTNEIPKKSKNIFISENFESLNKPIKLLYTDDSGTTQSYIITERLTALHINKLNNPTKDIGFGEPLITYTLNPFNLTVNNLFNIFYAKKLNTYKNSKLITANIWLNNNIVRELLKDPGRRIYVQEFNKYFILQSIKDYDIEIGDTKLTTIELFEYLSPNPINNIYKPINNVYINPTNIFEVGGIFLNNINLGENTVTGSNNLVNNNDNRIYSNNNIVYGGTNNTIGANTENVFLFGVSNYTADTSNIANFFGTTNITNQGVTTNSVTSDVVSATTLVLGDTIFTPDILTAQTQDLQSVLNIGNTISGGTMLEMSGTNINLGFTGNTVPSSANTYSTILNGQINSINLSMWSSIIGGGDNRINSSNYSGLYNGQFNTIQSGNSSTILGGNNNIISGTSTVRNNTIVGGFSNTIRQTSGSTIIGGNGNIISGQSNSTIIGSNNFRINNARNTTAISINSTTGVTRTGNNIVYVPRIEYMGTTPTLIAPLGATGSINGSDNGGIISLTYTSAPPQLFFILYTEAFTNGASIVVTPRNTNASTLNIVASSTNALATVTTATAITTGITYQFNYIVVPY